MTPDLESSRTVDPGRLVPAMARRWWLVVLLVALSIATALVLTSRQPSLYLASTTLVVAPDASLSDPSDILRGLEALERRTVIATFARIPSSAESRSRVAQRVGLDAGALGPYRFDARVLPNTNLVRLDVEGPDAERAADLANAAADVLGEEAQAIYRIYTLKPLARAAAPRRPTSPDRRRNVLVALLVGLALGFGAVGGLAWRGARRGA